MEEQTLHVVERTDEPLDRREASDIFIDRGLGPVQAGMPWRRPRVVALTCRSPFVWTAEYISDEEWDLLYGRDNKRFHRLRLYIPESVSRHDLKEAIDWLQAFIPEPETETWVAPLMNSIVETDVHQGDDSGA